MTMDIFPGPNLVLPNLLSTLLLFQPEMFGAVGDGVTDDTGAWIAAAAAAKDAGGGVVYSFGYKTYGIDGSSLPISVDGDNVYLLGSGKGVTNLKLLSAPSDDIISIVSGGAMVNCGVSDLTIDVGSFTGHAAIFAQSVTGFFARRVSVINVGTYGITAQGVTNFDISDNDVSRVTATGATQNNGVILFNSLQNTSGTIRGNRCTRMNMELDGADLRITENHVTDWKYGGGIVMGPDSKTHDNVVGYNVCTGGTGVDVDGTHVGGLELFSPRTLVLGNIASGNSGHGILLGGDSMTCVGNLSYENGVTGVDTSGIYVQDGGAQIGNNAIIVGNRCYGQDYGIGANGAVLKLTIRNNSLYGNNIAELDAGATAASGSTQGGTTYTVLVSDRYLTFTNAGTVTLTLPTAASCPRRPLWVRGTGGGAVVSASSNVVALAGGAAGTPILAAAAGKWAFMQSDGTNWVILAGN